MAQEVAAVQLVSDREIRKGNWIRALVERKDRQIHDCVMCKDEQLYLFAQQDIADILATYPSDKHGWFFNSSKDRYIGEKEQIGVVSLNPSFVDRHFVSRVYDTKETS